MTLSLYVIKDRRTGKFWAAGKCDRDNILEATVFENSERGFVLLGSNEEWEKLP